MTGRDLTPETAAVDHVLPVTKGGTSHISNLEVLHCDVNIAKGTLTRDEFIALCREVVSWVDSQQAGLCDCD